MFSNASSAPQRPRQHLLPGLAVAAAFVCARLSTCAPILQRTPPRSNSFLEQMWEDIGGVPGSAGLGAPRPDEQLGLNGQPAVESALSPPRGQPAGESHVHGEREPVEVELPAPSPNRPPCKRSVPSGFICPECGLFFADPEQLLVHHAQAHVVQ
jgi:hypothetical protein